MSAPCGHIAVLQISVHFGEHFVSSLYKINGYNLLRLKKLFGYVLSNKRDTFFN